MTSQESYILDHAQTSDATDSGTHATTPALQINNLTVTLGSAGFVAVDNVSMTLAPGCTLGLVGESGCGKSTLARTVLGLVKPQSGRVLVNGHDVHSSKGAALRSIRRSAQMIFQDPAGSLNPRMTVRDAILEPLVVHGLQTHNRAEELIIECGLSPDVLDRYPHQFSGGQRQRIAIARALALRPSLVICDEPTSALDVSVQAHILNLLRSLQLRYNIAYLFITHDMGVVAHMADTLAVMQRGSIIETGPTARVLQAPSQELTKRLAAAAFVHGKSPVRTPPTH